MDTLTDWTRHEIEDFKVAVHAYQNARYGGTRSKLKEAVDAAAHKICFNCLGRPVLENKILVIHMENGDAYEIRVAHRWYGHVAEWNKIVEVTK